MSSSLVALPADARRYTRTGDDCEEKRRAQALDLLRLSSIAEIEHADWMQLPPLDLSECDEVAHAQGVGRAGLVGGVAAADQDRLTVQEARGIGRADVE